jgi:coatomer subunit beta'
LQVIPCSSVLLDVYPLDLFFRFEPNKLISCSLNLTNNTDEQVAFGLVKKSDEQTCFLSTLSMFGIVDPRTTYTLVVIMNKHENLPLERNIDLILQTSTYYSILSDVNRCMQYFRNVEELGKTVHKVTLKGVCALQGDTIFEHSIPPSVKIISMEDNRSYLQDSFRCIDANQTEPL